MASPDTTVGLPTTSPTKRASQKKRHTKPCRYYQVGKCPHSAQEDCDFAHVYADQMPAIGPEPKQCRYWAQGNCTNGIWCQYKHGDAADAAVLEEYRQLALANQGLVVETTAAAVPPAAHPTYMSSAPWSPYSPDGFQYYQQYSDNASSLPPPGSDSSSDDYPLFSYSSVQYAVPLSPGFGPMPYEPFLPTSPGPMSPVFRRDSTPLYDIFGSPQPFFAGAAASQPASTWPDPYPGPLANRQRFPSYRTKPCRYFKPGSVCPNGEKCNFLHADQSETPTKEILKSTTAPPSTPEASPPSPLHASLPARPLSQREENTRRGYFPISWRVIGGGVLCGGPAKGGSDVDSDSISEDSIDDVLYTVPPGLGRPEQVTFAFPSIASTDIEPDAHDGTPNTASVASQAGTRQRASSIPSAPIIEHMDVLKLFLAESPGGL
ncbi:hypothetical protein MIND_00026700 [Mycena indigotica]|uniref:C3H1-type domain-containing protein n=1 Tax=Mycena indigotica TaxID=2126181 RepID=A0A8H6TD57_9AGAR|nr:uncharacterized protein MIND_00026700 [Mycena indigotica]KAF7315124.1 hypothetical protein MIND_00026700 [Mycena indigotica]